MTAELHAIYLMVGYDELVLAGGKEKPLPVFQDQHGHVAVAERFIDLGDLINCFIASEQGGDLSGASDFPGVVYYDVTEQMGKWFYSNSMCTDKEFFTELRRVYFEWMKQPALDAKPADTLKLSGNKTTVQIAKPEQVNEFDVFETFLNSVPETQAVLELFGMQCQYLALGYERAAAKHHGEMPAYQQENGHIAVSDMLSTYAWKITKEYLSDGRVDAALEAGSWGSVFEYEVTEVMGAHLFNDFLMKDEDFNRLLKERMNLLFGFTTFGKLQVLQKFEADGDVWCKLAGSGAFREASSAGHRLGVTRMFPDNTSVILKE